MSKRLIFYLVTIAALVLVYTKFSELQLIQQFFYQSNLDYLGLVVVVQVLFVFAQAINYQIVLKIKGLSVPVLELVPVGIVVQFISQAIPTAGVSGQIFFISYLKKFGLGLAQGIGRAILELATLYSTFVVFFLISAVLILRKNVFQQEPRFIYLMYAFLIFTVICVAIFLLSQKRQRASRFNWVVDRIAGYFKKNDISAIDYFTVIKEQFTETLNITTLMQKKWLFALACFWQGLLLFSHVLTLYIIAWSLGHPIPFAACFVAFTASKFFSMISVVPGAPGVFEGIMTLVLISFGVDKSVAFSATILTRAFTFWLPMPIGWILYGRYMKKFEAVVS